MRFCFTTLTILFILTDVLGQQRPINLGLEIYENNKLNFLNKNLVEEKDIAGDPYLDKKFQEAHILKVSGVEIKDTPLRYNIYSDNMEFRKEGKILAISFPGEILRIKLGTNIFIYTQYQLKNKIKHGYFQVLHESNYQLLKKYVITLKMPAKSATNDSMRFIRNSPVYYLRRNEGKPYLISSRKKLIKILQPVHQPVIDFIVTNKINEKNESKLIDLMNFLDENEN